MAERNRWMALKRVMDIAWHGEPNTAEILPLALNNEYLVARNAANTGNVNLIKANAGDVPELPSGTVLPAAALSGALVDTAGVNRLIVNPTAKTIVDGSATAMFEVAVAAGGIIGGIVIWLVSASNGTDHQAISGFTTYSAVNKAGTTTADITYDTANESKAVSSGTITLAFTITDDTNKVTFKVQPTGSLTETTPYNIKYTVIPIAGVVTIL
jgi:hypothetical protein